MQADLHLCSHGINRVSHDVAYIFMVTFSLADFVRMLKCAKVTSNYLICLFLLVLFLAGTKMILFKVF